jgi:hypothetical protein
MFSALNHALDARTTNQLHRRADAGHMNNTINVRFAKMLSLG